MLVPSPPIDHWAHMHEPLVFSTTLALVILTPFSMQRMHSKSRFFAEIQFAIHKQMFAFGLSRSQRTEERNVNFPFVSSIISNAIIFDVVRNSIPFYFSFHKISHFTPRHQQHTDMK